MEGQDTGSGSTYKIAMVSCMNITWICIGLQEAYNNLPVESKVTFLLSSVHNASMGEELRQMAAVLLRRLFSAEFMDFFPKVNTLMYHSFSLFQIFCCLK